MPRRFSCDVTNEHGTSDIPSTRPGSEEDRHSHERDGRSGMGESCQRQKRPPELPGSARFERRRSGAAAVGIWLEALSGSMGDMKAGNIQGLRDRTASGSRLKEGSQRLLGGGIFLCGGGAGKLLRELAEKALCWPGASFAKGAYRPPGDIIRDALEHAWIVGSSRPSQ